MVRVGHGAVKMDAEAGPMPLLAEDQEPRSPGSWKAHRLSSFQSIQKDTAQPVLPSETQFQISDFLNYQSPCATLSHEFVII